MDDKTRKKIIDMLAASYNMEIETVCNYLANSIHLDGFRAQEIRESLEEDVQEELNHARELATRIHVLNGRVPGSLDLKWEQKSLQPPKDTLDMLSVVKGVIEAEEGAIEQYRKIIEVCDGIDFVTQDMCIAIKRDEEQHRREFEGFLRDLQSR